MSEFTILVEKYGVGHAVAIVKNGILIDFLIDPQDENDCSSVGSIMTAKLLARQKGINGTFVALPGNRRGFLKGQHEFPSHSIIPVYVGTLSDPSKAQPVSAKLLFKGRFIILTPNSPGLNISRQIKCVATRDFISGALEAVSKRLPEKCGLIVRSQAVRAKKYELVLETNEKINQYSMVLADDLSEPRVIIQPYKALEYLHVESSFEESCLFVEEEFCFDGFGIWEQISRFLMDRVELENGGFLMVEQTSALVSIDVNTGADCTAAAAFKTNLLAMRELPRQLEVRGLGGKIVIDLAPIQKKDRLRVESELKQALKIYKGHCIILGWTNLGNLELQKKRYKLPISRVLKSDQRFC